MNRQTSFGSVNVYTIHAVNVVLEIQSAQFIRALGQSVAKNTKIHYQGRFLGLQEYDSWEYTYRTNASGCVVLVPLTDTGELVLVEQYRIPVRSQVLELPAGLVGDTDDPDESVQTAAQRELIEETGYHADILDELLTCPSSPGMTDEVVSIFFATGLTRVGPGGGNDDEEIVVHNVPLENAPQWLEAKMKEGTMVDPKIYAGLYWAGMRMNSK